ncbi:MAG: endonuclease I family protein [Hyalangium sp.]|uniref:endonuclease I family protein n=1 Tax=Hyalangium sp. TaxID=2028555 RepID=UPI00389A2BF1
MNSVSLQRPLSRPSAMPLSRGAAPSTASTATARAADRSSFSASPTRDPSMLTRLGSVFAPAAAKPTQPTPSTDDPFQGLRDAALIKAIHDSSAGKHVVSYNEARKIIFTNLDVHNGKVKDVYTGREIAGGKVPSSSDMNVEHTWPQSKGAVGEAKSDLHHLFPVDSKANGTRGNFPFGKVAKVQWSSPSGAKFGLDAQGRKVFEPPDAHKGDVARAMFYFSSEYNKHIPPEEESVLREWNKLDAVDAAELDRDQRIAAIQGNVNQFVEHSDLADRIQDF